MTTAAPVVVRVAPGVHWHALEDDEVVGRAHALHRPDDRVFVSVDTWRDDVFARLVAAVVADLPGDLRTRVDEDDTEELARWSAAGFGPHRREAAYLVPTAVDPAGPGAVPAGFALLSAADAEEDRLRRLDEIVREDVPGTDGWVNDPEEFHAHTFDPRLFDPDTYLVAVHEATGEYAGLVRIWRQPRCPVLGLVGVRRPCRRLGLARGLLAAAFGPLRERGIEHVLADADVADTAATALLAGLGARRTGGSVELLRRPAGLNRT